MHEKGNRLKMQVQSLFRQHENKMCKWLNGLGT